jgi:hypothetical protein
VAEEEQADLQQIPEVLVILLQQVHHKEITEEVIPHLLLMAMEVAVELVQ